MRTYQSLSTHMSQLGRSRLIYQFYVLRADASNLTRLISTRMIRN